MKYCHLCAAELTLRIPEGDDKHRHCCTSCDNIIYQNPKNVVGTLPVYGDQVLLCKRAIQPRLGKWTLPAGFMENGESTLEGAIRETIEEAGARLNVSGSSLYTLFNLPKINQVYMFFKADLADLDFAAGMESLEVGLFREEDIPWQELAFPVVYTTLKEYFKDKPSQSFPVRMFDVLHHGGMNIETILTSHSHTED